MTIEQLQTLLGQEAAPKPKPHPCEGGAHAFRALGRPTLARVDGGWQQLTTMICPRHNPPLMAEVPGEFVPDKPRLGMPASEFGRLLLTVVLTAIVVILLISNWQLVLKLAGFGCLAFTVYQSRKK